MLIDVLASGSSGNCYRINNGVDSLLIECGLPISRIRQGLRDIHQGLTNLAGCLISHDHGDHARAIKDMLAASVDVYASRGTLQSLEVSEHHRTHELWPHQQVRIASFAVMPFDTVHDAADPLGFLIASGGEKLLYASDMSYLQYRFVGLTHLMLECNYSSAKLAENVGRGSVAPELKRRVTRSHMGLETVLDMLRANDLSQVRGIWLLHLSDSNSDEVEFKNAVERVTGRPCYVAGGEA